MKTEVERQLYDYKTTDFLFRLHGSYEALKGGGTSEAMEDFTGGVAVLFELKEPLSNMFQIMEKCFTKQSLMACAMEVMLQRVFSNSKEN